MSPVDIAAMLALPRVTGPSGIGKHEVDPSIDLVSKGIVRFVRTF